MKTFKNLLLKCYAINNYRLKKLIFEFALKIDSGEQQSRLIREIFRKYHLVDIGMYSYGGCFNVHNVEKYVTIGRYCSFAQNIRIMTRNHPVQYKSTHPFFFNPALGKCEEQTISFIPKIIGNDVWVGYSSLILPRVETVGDGAIIAAGAVVTKDVPPYAIVAGNPAKVVKYRFPDNVVADLLSSKWWEKSIDELCLNIMDFQKKM